MADEIKGPIELTPKLHFEESLYPYQKGPFSNSDKFPPTKKVGQHFTAEKTITHDDDAAVLTAEERNLVEELQNRKMDLFDTSYSGSSTLRNPNFTITDENGNNPVTVYSDRLEEEKTMGYSDSAYNYVASEVENKGNFSGSRMYDFSNGSAYREGGMYGSPIAPFAGGIRDTYRDPFSLARMAISTSLNCFRMPMVDLERPKMFRNIFISRPECYIMSHSFGSTGDSTYMLSEQCYNDDDFASSYAMFPHVAKLLSPSYVCDMSLDGINSNWNWLLTNRLLTLDSRQGSQIKTTNNTKSTIGSSIVTGGFTNIYEPKTFTATFRDTRHLDVYEMIRMWMLYISKTTRGELTPSYNDYQFRNEFIQCKGQSAGSKIQLKDENFYHLHPYDRAIDYACTFFDIICDESNTKVVNWSKYYGCFPINVSVSGLTNEKSKFALEGEVTVNVTFQYQCVRENVNMNLVEFNYNAGIVDKLGRTISTMVEKCQQRVSHYIVRDHSKDGDLPFSKYRGPGNMFTGTPFIMMGDGTISPDSTHDNMSRVIAPYLFFLPISTGYSDDSVTHQRNEVNRAINIGLTEVRNNEGENGFRPGSDTFQTTELSTTGSKTESVTFEQLEPEPIPANSETFNVPSVNINEVLAKVKLSDTQQAMMDITNANYAKQQETKRLQTIEKLETIELSDTQQAMVDITNANYDEQHNMTADEYKAAAISTTNGKTSGLDSNGNPTVKKTIYTNFGINIAYRAAEECSEFKAKTSGLPKTRSADTIQSITVYGTIEAGSNAKASKYVKRQIEGTDTIGSNIGYAHYYVDSTSIWQAMGTNRKSGIYTGGVDVATSIGVCAIYGDTKTHDNVTSNTVSLVAYLCTLYNIQPVEITKEKKGIYLFGKFAGGELNTSALLAKIKNRVYQFQHG